MHVAVVKFKNLDFKKNQNTLKFRKIERVRIPHLLKILIGRSVNVIANVADFFQNDTK